ncbi:hypothetical protein [Variovorax sp. LjRoot175]|uniref:hypothetical protein n=1 Tax=Variovorax sp. LjRoot175 TaxID=3342276 RepID=UPI003F512163
MTTTRTEHSNVPRSLRPSVRNPLIELPAAREIQALPEDTRKQLRALLLDIRASAQVKAEQSWRRCKGPMALYWKVVAVYAGHIARLLR